MKALAARLTRREHRQERPAGAARITLQFGYLKTLPDDYVGPWHVVTLRQIPPEELAPSLDLLGLKERGVAIGGEKLNYVGAVLDILADLRADRS